MTPNASVLILDDEDKIRQLLTRIIGLEGYHVDVAEDIKTATKKLEKQSFDLVLSDVKLPDGTGLDFLKHIKTNYPFTEVILLTAYGNIPDGVKAIQNGAFDYITKGDDNDRILPLLSRACEKVQLQKRIQQLEKKVSAKYNFEEILGNAYTLTESINMAKKVAETDATVLLLGETGTGKEVFAQAIHYESLRKKGPFVAINCSALSKDLLESEMFGHVAGAFTGALKDKKGLFEEADNGTIFLDEIGEMPLELQAKLLRVLESNEFIKVGQTQSKKVNVRIIAATNRDLKPEIEKGNFREDIFYRLSVFQINLPPLRERMADLDLLVKQFVAQFSAKTNKHITKIQPEYLTTLKQHNWPGNVRELKNIIERSVILTTGDTLTIDTLPINQNFSNTFNTDSFELAEVEKNHIQKVLNHTKGNKTEAARLLNIGVATLYRKIEEFKLTQLADKNKSN